MIDVVNTKVIHISDEIPNMETQGERLKRLREIKNLSQGELAKRAGLKSQGAIGNIERDTRGYGASVIDIARELGTTPDYLRMEVASVQNTEPGPSLRGDAPLISSVAAGEGAHPGAAPPLADTLAQLGRVIAASDKLTRAQIKPILDQLLEYPEQAVELGRRLEATVTLNQGSPSAHPTPVADKVLAAKPITRTVDIIKKAAEEK